MGCNHVIYGTLYNSNSGNYLATIGRDNSICIKEESPQEISKIEKKPDSADVGFSDLETFQIIARKVIEGDNTEITGNTRIANEFRRVQGETSDAIKGQLTQLRNYVDDENNSKILEEYRDEITPSGISLGELVSNIKDSTKNVALADVLFLINFLSSADLSFTLLINTIRMLKGNFSEEQEKNIKSGLRDHLKSIKGKREGDPVYEAIKGRIVTKFLEAGGEIKLRDKEVKDANDLNNLTSDQIIKVLETIKNQALKLGKIYQEGFYETEKVKIPGEDDRLPPSLAAAKIARKNLEFEGKAAILRPEMKDQLLELETAGPEVRPSKLQKYVFERRDNLGKAREELYQKIAKITDRFNEGERDKDLQRELTVTYYRLRAIESLDYIKAKYAGADPGYEIQGVDVEESGGAEENGRLLEFYSKDLDEIEKEVSKENKPYKEGLAITRKILQPLFGMVFSGFEEGIEVANFPSAFVIKASVFAKYEMLQSLIRVTVTSSQQAKTAAGLTNQRGVKTDLPAAGGLALMMQQFRNLHDVRFQALENATAFATQTLEQIGQGINKKA